MELATKGDLQQVINDSIRRQRRIPESQLWMLGSQLASALAFLHQHGILHRDVKPANCFLDGAGGVKLGDMNISKLLGGGQQLTQTYVGTPYYMSPEIWRRRPYGAKTDVWSLGCVLYQLAGLRVPFRGRTLPQLERSVLRGCPAPLPAHYSFEWTALVRALLLPQPARRPPADKLLERMRHARPELVAPDVVAHISRIIGVGMPRPQYTCGSNSMPRLPPIGRAAAAR